MDIILVSITGISLALAVGMGAVLFKLLRDERLRSDARVAFLASAAAPEESSPGLDEPLETDPSPSSWSESRIRDRSSDTLDARGNLFAAHEPASPWPRRLAVAGVLGLLVSLIGLGLMPGASAPQEDADSRQIAPLELLELRHTLEAGALTITGIVQNPRAGGPLSNISVTAALFGADGAPLASGRAGLDYVTLAPGVESPFVIKIPVTAAVARYRVGFRGPDGAVIAHVDRRADGTSARNERIMENAPWLR
jgi:hypothetical protein